MTTKLNATTREELEALTKDELALLADRRSVTVTREDGEDGEPLKSDYVAALVAAANTTTGAPRERITSGRFCDAQGNPVNADGDRIDAAGNLLEA